MKINIQYYGDDKPSELELARLDIAEMLIRQHDENIMHAITAHIIQCNQQICDDIQHIIADQQHETAHKIENIYK